MKNKVVGLGVAMVMTGCGDDAPAPQAQAPAVETRVVEVVEKVEPNHDEATKAALEQSNKEQEELKEFLAAAKERDPSIVDAYYSVDEEGNKIINLVRNAAPAAAATAAAPATPGAAPTPAAEEDEGLGMLETVGLAMAGGAAGALLANALIPKDPPRDYYQNNSAYYQRQTPEEAQRYRSSATANYQNHSMSNHMRNSSSMMGKSTVSSTSGGALTSSKPAFRTSMDSQSSRSSSYVGKSSSPSSSFGG